MISVTFADHVLEKLRELEQSTSLRQIQQLFECKEYSLVAQKLEPFLEYNTTIPTDVSLCGKCQSLRPLLMGAW